MGAIKIPVRTTARALSLISPSAVLSPSTLPITDFFFLGRDRILHVLVFRETSQLHFPLLAAELH